MISVSVLLFHPIWTVHESRVAFHNWCQTVLQSLLHKIIPGQKRRQSTNKIQTLQLCFWLLFVKTTEHAFESCTNHLCRYGFIAPCRKVDGGPGPFWIHTLHNYRVNSRSLQEVAPRCNLFSRTNATGGKWSVAIIVSSIQGYVFRMWIQLQYFQREMNNANC